MTAAKAATLKTWFDSLFRNYVVVVKGHVETRDMGWSKRKDLK